MLEQECANHQSIAAQRLQQIQDLMKENASLNAIGLKKTIVTQNNAVVNGGQTQLNVNQVFELQKEVERLNIEVQQRDVQCCQLKASYTHLQQQFDQGADYIKQQQQNFGRKTQQYKDYADSLSA